MLPMSMWQTGGPRQSSVLVFIRIVSMMSIMVIIGM